MKIGIFITVYYLDVKNKCTLFQQMNEKGKYFVSRYE